jgi:hypothetical protein
MDKKAAIFVLVFFISAAAIGAGVGGGNLLRDGFVLAGVEGKLAPASNRQGLAISDSNEWLFEFDSDVSDGTGRINAGEKIELLPSAGLERIIADAEKQPAVSYRLWGRVTTYRYKNFIFPIYFLAVGETDRQRTEQPQKQQQPETQLTINEPNDVLALPEEIIAKLQTRKIIQPQQLQKGLELKTDCILADRTGFIREKGDEPEFVFDGLGRNVPEISIKLVACEVLERAERQQLVEPEPVRFKVAGIVTRYKGENYLLLQRATRVYSHGNF